MINNSVADGSPANSLRSIFRPRSSAYALEPRVMFDAAAAVAADEHLADKQATAKPSDTAAVVKASAPAVDSTPGTSNTAGALNATLAPITLLVVDSRVTDYQSLLADLPGNVMVRVINVGESGLDAITQAIDGASGSKAIESIQIVSHGSSGSLSLGRDTLDSATLGSHSIQLQRWAPHLAANADILLYGCDIAAGAGGSALITQLAALTGADIAASTDTTGGAAKGGNWVLEQQTGQIDSRLVLSAATLARYDSLLAAPVNTVPGPQIVAEDNTITFGAGKIISIADADGSVQSVSLGVAHGTLTLATTTGLTLSGNGTANISITAGSIVDINAALFGLVYRPAANFAGADSLTIVTNDGSSTDTDSVAISVTPNATAPVLTLPTKSQTVVEDTPSALDFTGTNAIVLTDADVNDLQTLTLSVTHGTLNIGVAGGASIIGGNGTGSVILSGTALQLSTTLVSGVQYSPSLNYNSTAGPEALSFNLNDGQHTKTGSVTINVTPVNDAPTISGGSPLSVAEGGTTTFSAAVTVGSGFAQSQLGLADVDTSAVQATIKIAGLPAHGSLKLNGNPVAVGSTLSVADIDKLSYTHDGSQVIGATSDTFFLTVDDGAGGLLTNQPVSVNLTPVNQPPSVSASITVIEGETGVRLDLNGALPTLGTARGAISVSDPEGATITTYNITSLPAHGTLFYNGVAISAASVGTPFIVLDKTLLTYSHDGSETSTDSFNMSVTDDGGGTGTPASTAGTINLNIYPNNDDPVLAAHVTQTLGASSLIITPAMLRVTDVDSSGPELTYTLKSVPDPLLGYFKLNGNTLVAGATFTQADIDAGHLIYVSRSNTPRTDGISFTVKDSGQRIYPTLRDGGIYDSGTDTLTVNTFNIVVPNSAPTDGSALPPFAPVNVAPVTGGSNIVSLLESETVPLTNAMLLATDADNTAVELVYRLHSLPTSGTVRLDGIVLLTNQTFTQNDVNLGRVTFAHAGGEDFIDAFTYTVSDGKSESSLRTFNIATTPQNDTPSATTAGQLIAEGGGFTVTPTHIVLADADNSNSDNETGYAVNNVLSFLITGTVTHGTLELNGINVVANTTVVTSAELAAGKLVYTHDGSETVSDSFKLVPVDDKGITALTATATNQISTGAEVSVPIAIYPLNDAPSYFSKLDLTGVRAIQEGSTVTIGGASSYAIINGVTGSGVPTPVAGAHLVFGDNDNSSVQRQYRVTATTLNGQLMLNGATLGVGSVFTQADLDSGRITYKHNGTETSSDAFSYVVSDGDWTVNDSQIFPQGTAPTASTFLIQITPRNDVPTLTAPASLDAFAAGAGTTAITGVTLADLDLADGVTPGETDFVRVEVQVLDNANALVGTALLSYGAADPVGGSAFLSGKNTNSLIVQGSKAQVDAILASLTIAFSADADASDYKIRIIADDRLYDAGGVLTSGANGGPGPNNADGSAIDASNNRVTKDIILRASNFNDVPTITNASAYSVHEDAQITLGGFAIADADSFGEDVSVTVRLYSDALYTTPAIAATQGALILGATTGLTSSSGNNTNTITLTGSLSEVQAALNDLKFAGAPNYNGLGLGNTALYLSTTIADFFHAGSQKTATVDNTITIVPVNDQPTLSVPSNQTLSNGINISINSGFAVGDAVDIGQGATDYVEVTVAATLGGPSYGTISVTPGSATVDNNGSAIIVVKGTTSAVQTALNTFLYTPASPNVDGTVVITTTVDDRFAGVGNGKEGTGVDGNNTNSTSFNINISSINDAPVISAPLAVIATEDLTFGFTGANQISIADSDDFGAPEKVILDLGASPKGTLTLTTLTGLSFTTGDGTADTQMEFTGTKAAINAALATLVFTPTANINTVGVGNAQSLSINVDDLGNTGSNGALTDSRTVSITITPVNDAPTRTAATTSLTAVPEDTSVPPGDTVTSLFTGVFSDITDTQAGGSIANPLAGIAIVGNAATAAQGKWQYNSGLGWADLPTAPSLVSPFLLKTTDQVRFLPTGNWNGTPGQLTVRLIDASSGTVTSGAGPDLSGAATGGTTAYSDALNAVTLTTSVTAVNDAPLASGTATLTAINEDTANPPGALVSTLITGANYSDATDTVSGGSSATALGGIAIVGNTADAATQGAWQYSTNNGASWSPVPTGGLGDTSALVLPTAAMLRFVPVANYNGTPGGLSVRLADSVQGFSASSDISPAIGTTGTWSAASIPVATSVNPINDAPTLSGLTAKSFTEDGSAVVIGTSATLADTELSLFAASTGNWGNARITISRNGGANAEDSFSASGTLSPLTQGSTLVDGATTIGTVSANSAGTLTITFAEGVTTAQVQGAIRQIAYGNSRQTLGAGASASVTLNWLLEDGDTDPDRVTNPQGSGGNQSVTLAQSITLNGVNDTPVANADVATAIEAGGLNNGTAGSNATGNVLSNDTDVDAGDTKTVTVGTGARTGTYGTLTLNANGSYTYVVDESNVLVQALRVTGQTVSEVFSYTMADTTGATSASTLTITIDGRNDTPVANADVATAIEAGGLNNGTAGSNATGNVLTNDTDVDAGDTRTVTVGTGVRIGLYGTLTLNANGSYTYVVDESNVLVQALRVTGQTVSEVFSYTMADTAGATSASTLTITIDGRNDTPVANADVATAIEAGGLNNGTAGSNATGNVLSNDTDVDAGDTRTVTVGTGVRIGLYGTLTLSADGSYTYVVDESNPAVQALRVTGQTVSEVFNYTMADMAGATSASTLTITIDGRNDTPVANADTDTVIQDATVTRNAATGVLANDSDVDATDTKTVTQVTQGGTTQAVISGTPGVITSAYGTLTLNSDGSYSYLADGLASKAIPPGHTAADTFSYTMRDTNGLTSTTTLTITISGLNEAPVAEADTGSALEAGGVNNGTPGSSASGNVLDNDTDLDSGDTKTVTVVTGSGAGTVGGATPGAHGTLLLNADGTYTYTIDNNDAAVQALRTNGNTLTDIFTYTMRDTIGATSSTTLTITIQGANDAPLAVADTGTAVEAGGVNNLSPGSDATGNVLINDTDVDSVANGETKTVSAVSGGTVYGTTTGSHGSLILNSDGSYTYSVNNSDAAVQALRIGDTLSDTFTYTVMDTAGLTSSTTLTIAIQGANDAPLATDDKVQSPAGRPITIKALINDSDPEGDPLTITTIAGISVSAGSTVTLPSGKVTLNADGTLSFVANPGFQGDVLFPYEISDGHGGTAAANVSITVAPAVDVFPTAPMPLTPLWISPPMESNLLPFVPAIFVNDVVQGFQGDRAATDPFAFSDPRAVRFGEIESPSIGAGLGFDPALFVQPAVRASQLEGAFLDNVIDGRTIRINLSSERLIPTPELALPNAGLIATPVADRVSEPVREAQEQALARPPVAQGQLIAGSEQPAAAQRAAPSFSEQLRNSGSRTFVSSRDKPHSIRARSHI